MIRLEDIKEAIILRGADPSQAVRVLQGDRLSDQAISLTYKTDGDQIHKTILFMKDAAFLMLPYNGRPYLHHRSTPPAESSLVSLHPSDAGIL